MTTEKYSKITGASKPTASRDLVDLLQKGGLISCGVGKATKYYVNVPGWHQVGAVAWIKAWLDTKTPVVNPKAIK